MNSIFTRRSVRRFNSNTVEKEKIEKLLRAAMQAPSAKNGRPWEFIVVSGKDNLLKLSTFSPYSSSLAYANVAIIVLGNTKSMVMPEYYQQDLSAATQNILLEATELNLGSVWYGVTPEISKMSYISNMFNLDSSLMPFSVIGIGYPEIENANTFIDRYDESKVTYIN